MLTVVEGRDDEVTPLWRAPVRHSDVGILPHAVAIPTEGGHDEVRRSGIRQGNNNLLAIEDIRAARMAPGDCSG